VPFAFEIAERVDGVSSYDPAVGSVVHDVRSQLGDVFAGRSVVLAGGVAVSARRPIEQLRALGAPRFLVLCSSAGTGELPDGADVEILFEEGEIAESLLASFRDEERWLATPSSDVRTAVDRFDPEGTAMVIVPPFLDVRSLGERRAFGARRSEWVALEDKTRADALFDVTGVPRPPSAVVPADASSIERAVADLDRGAGTVWSGDARDGFNGGGEFVRWVRDDDDRAGALDLLVPNCDLVRIASFVDGVPCSIHGVVLGDGVAVLRPVELVTLRAPSAPRLHFCGCATFFDPPAAIVETMRAAVARVGEHLRSTVDFRGAFTLDGIASADGWFATECNPRFGAGLRYVDAVLPDLCLGLLLHAVVEGVADVSASALEELVVEAASRKRWGNVSLPLTRVIEETSSLAIVGGVDGFRAAEDGEDPDGVMWMGPGRSGGHVRIEFEPDGAPVGPSLAPLTAAGMAFAEAAFDLGIGPLSAPPSP
jgi:hypothetical protein